LHNNSYRSLYIDNKIPFKEARALSIRVVKLSECGYGRAALSAIKTVGSSPARPTKAKSRRLEFIGDSITCGYGNQCSNQSPKFVTREENAARTYAFFLGQLLDAEVHCICASGNGIYHDYGCHTHNLIPELYKYTDKMLAEHFGLKASLWDRKRYVPDMVVIKLGAKTAVIVTVGICRTNLFALMRSKNSAGLNFPTGYTLFWTRLYNPIPIHRFYI